MKDGPASTRQRGTQAPARGDPQDRLHNIWRLRPAHGARPHDRARGADLGHEITGEVTRPDPGSSSSRRRSLLDALQPRLRRCRMCKTGNTGVCLNVNPDRPGSAYATSKGRLGRWPCGVRAWALRRLEPLEVPDRITALEKNPDLTMAVGHLPDRYHGCYTAGVTSARRSTIAGGGPVGLAGPLGPSVGAAVVIVGA